MRLKDEMSGPGSFVPYRLDAGDGRLAESRMPADVAAEIARRADSVEPGGEDGFEAVVDGKMMFPADMFDFEEGELDRPAPKKPRRTRKAAESAGK